ncbi:jg2508 [Pararge aegeria aegeria]|uniref:Jg2508 protein n=1 Tax=Pararge aegeria aegeria TaxID=348720 RepID=A0A8S4SHS1_9NEOP|nr:jg2508 [Pararge aegeria aegeria]
MANNATGDNTKAIVPYSNEINECHLHIVFSIECIEAKVLLQKKLSKHTKHQKQVCYFMRNANAIMRNEIKLDQQKKESLLVALESNKSRMIDLKKQLLLAKEGRQNMIENIKINIKKYEDKWLTCKSRFESIHFIKRYFEVNDKIETVRGNISSLIIETKKLSNDINLKKTELINLGQKYIIELADYMIHQRPIILKLIDDKRNEIKKIVKEKENNNATVKNALLVSPPEKRTIKAKNVSDEDTEYLPKNEAHDTLVVKALYFVDISG